MAAWFALRHPARRLVVALALGTLLGLHQPVDAAGEPEVIVVQLDQARIARLPDRAATIVVGNPLIADVSLQTGGLLVLTGKGYGVTNLVALDRTGAVLSEFLIQVEAASNTNVVVYRGADRESFSCTPDCVPRVSLGDTQTYFNSTMNQTVLRTGRSQAAGAPAGGGAR